MIRRCHLLDAFLYGSLPVCALGAAAGAIYHTDGNFSLSSSSFRSNRATDSFSAIHSTDTSLITDTSVIAHAPSQSVVAVGEGSPFPGLRLQCGEGQEVTVDLTATRFNCLSCPRSFYLLGDGIWEPGALRNCSACPHVGMLCEGGASISALAGFGAVMQNDTVRSPKHVVNVLTTLAYPVMCPRAASCNNTRPLNETLCAYGYAGT